MEWRDLNGTSLSYFRIGLTGPRIKAASTTSLTVRNAGDTADADITVGKLNVSGLVLDMNSDAAGSGADWKYTLTVPSSGMTAAVNLTLPVDDGTPGQVLSTDGSGVTSWVSAGSTAACLKEDSTDITFGSTSSVAMFTTGVGDVIKSVTVVIDTTFNGTPSMSVGIVSSVSKYAAATLIDLTAAAGTSFEITPNKSAQGIESLITTYSAGGASSGAARVIVAYSTPS